MIISTLKVELGGAIELGDSFKLIERVMLIELVRQLSQMGRVNFFKLGKLVMLGEPSGLVKVGQIICASQLGWDDQVW